MQDDVDGGIVRAHEGGQELRGGGEPAPMRGGEDLQVDRHLRDHLARPPGRYRQFGPRALGHGAEQHGVEAEVGGTHVVDRAGRHALHPDQHRADHGGLAADRDLQVRDRLRVLVVELDLRNDGDAVLVEREANVTCGGDAEFEFGHADKPCWSLGNRKLNHLHWQWLGKAER